MTNQPSNMFRTKVKGCTFPKLPKMVYKSNLLIGDQSVRNRRLFQDLLHQIKSEQYSLQIPTNVYVIEANFFIEMTRRKKYVVKTHR